MTGHTFKRWKSHKIVTAGKIVAIVDYPLSSELTVLNDKDEPVRFGVSKEYREKHKPQVGGYWVRYMDGYESFSPAEAFEDGYTLYG